jgi:hypothetical protein
VSRLQGETRELPVVLDEGELSHLRKLASEAAEIVRTGKARRDVSCTWKHALAEGWRFLVRDDTGERIESRKLKDEERQLVLGEPPYALPTPDELAEWLKALPVNEPEELGEGHAGAVGAEDRAADLGNPEGGVDLAAQEEPFEEWAEEMAEDPGDLDFDDPASDTEEEILEEEIDRAVEAAAPPGFGLEPAPAYVFLCTNCEAEFNDPDLALTECPLCHAGRLLEHQSPDPPLNLNPSLPELVAMPDDQAEKLVKRSRAKR